jgi:hypothetical protein
VTTENPFEPQDTAVKDTIFFDGLIGVLGTGGGETATAAWFRKIFLIKTNRGEYQFLHAISLA